MDEEDKLVISKEVFLGLMQDIIWAIDHNDTSELSSTVYDLAWHINHEKDT